MIAQTLTSENIPTPAGKNVWNTSTVDSILKNEKYRGAALLQKRFTTDFLSKTSKKNEGELPQYYIDKSHECCPYVSTMHTPEKPENRAFLGDLRMHTPL